MINKTFKIANLNIAVCSVFILFSSHSFASETSLADAFVNAKNYAEGGKNQITYKFENCVLQTVLTNLNYCKIMDQGEGHRLITTTIDFREVAAITVDEVHSHFYISFDLDFERPGRWSIFVDRLFNGNEDGFNRYLERSATALEESELTSGTTFSNCDGSEPQKTKETSIALFTELEPDGWPEMIDLVRECRSPKPLEFENRRSEK